MRSIFTPTLALLLSASPILADGNIYDRCNAAISAGDEVTVRDLATLIRKFNTFPRGRISDAERCVSAAEGKLMKMLSTTGTFVPASEIETIRKKKTEEIEAQKKLAEQRRKTEQERQRILEAQRQDQAARERRAELRKQLNQILIADDVFKACRDLYERDRIATMTNDVCIDSFSMNGHPHLMTISPAED